MDQPQGPSPRVKTLIWLGLFFALALTLRIAFSVEPAFNDEAGRYMYEGNDPYYHHRTVEHILETGDHLVFDPAINYPQGGYNPNPPIFDWTTAPVAAFFQEYTDVKDPVGLALNVMVAVWGALTVIPVYMIGRALWGRAAGLWSGFFIAVSAPHIQRGIFGFADHDATTMFFITLAFAFLVKGLQSVHVREYVTDWRHGAARSAGLREAFRQNRTAFAWSALSGVALTATALTWKGYPYALGVMVLALTLQLVADHLRKRDSTPVFGVYMLPLLMVALLPYLLLYRAFPTFLDTTFYPSLMVVGAAAVIGLFMVPTRDLPSVLVFPALVLAAAAAVAALFFLWHDAFVTIFTGLGYFRQTRLYSTIAEAQRSELGRVAANFGFFTFLLVFWGLGRVLRGTYKGDAAQTLVAGWALIALFMAFAATRFIMNAAPIFCILIGGVTAWIMSRIGLDEVRRRWRARHGQGAMTAGAGALTWKSVLGLAAVTLFLVVPNFWIGVDAAVPTNYEVEHDLSRDWFGAFGISLDMEENGWHSAMTYLAGLDTGVPLEDRPAFVAWWDYGHWATGIGRHPTVADPFQNHFNIAGRFLASESEEEATAWLTILLVNGAHGKGGAAWERTAAALSAVDPALTELGPMSGYDREYDLYGQHVNTTGEEPFDLYEAVMEASGKRILYMGVDDRMFPAGVNNEGIFYAPLYLANKNPDDFLQTTYRAGGKTLYLQQYRLDDDNRTVVRLEKSLLVDRGANPSDPADDIHYEIYGGAAYPKGKTPLSGADINSGLQLTAPDLTPSERFYNTMYYRAFGGTLSFATENLDGQTVGSPAGRDLQHWRAIHESTTALSKARRDAAQLGENASFRRVVLLEYFSGVTVNGTVQDDAGTALPGLQVAFQDRFGGRHGSAVTGADGGFSVLAPFSVDGDLEMVVLAGGQEIHSTAEHQFARDADGLSTQPILIEVPRGTVFGHVYRDLDGDGAFNATADEAIAGATVTVGDATATSDTLGLYSVGPLPPGSRQARIEADGFATSTRGVVVSGDVQQDFALAYQSSPVNATVTDGGQPVSGVTVRTEGPTATSAATDTAGLAVLTLQPGSYNVTVTGQGFVGNVSSTYDTVRVLEVPVGGQPVQWAIETRDDDAETA